jgi:hypothetical protein
VVKFSTHRFEPPTILSSCTALLEISNSPATRQAILELLLSSSIILPKSSLFLSLQPFFHPQVSIFREVLLTIPPSSKHLAHKVWVGVLKGVELFPCSVVGRLPLPQDQKFNQRPIILRPSASIEDLCGFWLGNAICVDWREPWQGRRSRAQFGFELRHVEDPLDTGI